ncbi:MAG TPA: DUF47 family protein [Verrucomicrobiae bacterium]|nr:DUF47 family protein [Verrucomicrobiae bacterium]
MFGLKPKEDRFFHLFEECTELLVQSTAVLNGVMEDYTTASAKMEQITELEHKADQVTAGIIDMLNQTMITPMDREDIYTLASQLDDIIDFIQGAIERMMLYKAGQPSKGAQELVRILSESAEVIHTCFVQLRNIRSNRDKIIDNSARINALESEADRVYRQEVAKLFQEEKNPIEVIKWKEILEHLETAVDHCEDVGDLIKGVVLKYA